MTAVIRLAEERLKASSIKSNSTRLSLTWVGISHCKDSIVCNFFCLLLTDFFVWFDRFRLAFFSDLFSNLLFVKNWCWWDDQSIKKHPNRTVHSLSLDLALDWLMIHSLIQFENRMKPNPIDFIVYLLELSRGWCRSSFRTSFDFQLYVLRVRNDGMGVLLWMCHLNLSVHLLNPGYTSYMLSCPKGTNSLVAWLDNLCRFMKPTFVSNLRVQSAHSCSYFNIQSNVLIAFVGKNPLINNKHDSMPARSRRSTKFST